ncbi:hypothetical protein H4S07_007055, partial [Coemansia furcata]
EEACLECIQACERVAEAVLNGDFSARVRCSRCHTAPDDDDNEDDAEWPMLPKSGATRDEQSNTSGTPIINRPVTHTQRLANRVNRMASLLSHVTREIVDVAHNDGVCGNLGAQGDINGLKGSWLDLVSEVNTMTTIHSEHIRNIAQVCTSVSNGDLSSILVVEANGEMRDHKMAINTMVQNLNTFAAQVSMVTTEVGTEGRLGCVANADGLDGIWKDLANNMNSLSYNFTVQVREISSVARSVLCGDLTKKVTADLNGELGELKDTINNMVDQLSTFASEVSRVTREVGTEGILGGVAIVPNVEGVWKDLTDN